MGELLIIPKDELTAVLQTVIAEAIAPLLANIIKPINVNEDGYINVEQAAMFLHKKKSTIYFLVSKRSIPAYKRGNKLLFKKIELQQWADQGKRKTNDELVAMAKQRNT